MEKLIDLVKPKTYNKVGYVFIVLWIIIGAILFGIFLEMETSESSDFRCAAKLEKIDLVRAKCFEQYKNRHSKSSVPVYAFVILNFLISGIFCVIYSRHAVPIVDRLLDERQRLPETAERGRELPPKKRRLSGAYFCQLAARLALGILFLVLQTQLLYPSYYPSNFDCNLTPETSRLANASAGNIQNTTYECHNQRATPKTFWLDAVIGVNAFFAVIILIEIIWIFSRARKTENFLEDSQFLADHLPSGQQLELVQNPPQWPTQQEPQQVSQETQLAEMSSLNNHRQASQVQEPPQGTPQQEPEQQVSQETQPEELPSSIIHGFIERLKEFIIKHTEKLPDLEALFQPNHGEGERIEDLKLDSIYTNLVLIPDRAKYDFSGNREEQLKEYPMPKENFQPMKGPEDIFTEPEKKKILLVGRPGIGKTMFCTKMIRDWAREKLFIKTQNGQITDLNFAFLIKFRRLNSVDKLSLRQLLEMSEYLPKGCLSDQVWKCILDHPDKVLMLFDGLDEFHDISSTVSEEVNNEYRHSDHEDEMPLATLYSKIVNEELLPGSAVVTSIRPSAVSSVTRLPFKRTVEILGFSSQEVEEYVKNFTKDAAENLSDAGETTAAENLSDAGETAAKNFSDAGEKIWQHISTNMNLFSLCYIPVNCFIICSCLLQVLKFYTKKGNVLTGVGLPTKLTQIYKRAVKLFFFKHNEQYRDKPLSREEIESDNLPPEVEEKFKRLRKVAFNGIKERRLIFVKSEVQGLENSSLFYQMPDCETNPFKHEAQFCFMHLTMQEFLAAKYITDPDTMNEEELRRFVSDNIKKGEWKVVLQFVAGLLGERDDKSIEIFTSLLPVKTEKISDETTCWPTDSDKHLALTIIKCLYEGSKLEVINSLVQSKLDSINCDSVYFSRCGVAPADCTALVHIIKNMKQISHIYLFNNHIGSLGCVEIKKLLESDKSKLTSLGLMNNGIGDEGLVHLSQGIKTSRLAELWLRGNKDITPEAKQRFREDNPNCKVYFEL